MVPAFVIPLDKIPLNVNGKVDRRALPQPDVSSLKAEYAAPRNDAERIICEAFSQALGIDTVGIDDDFIRLGGDSLKAIRAGDICRRNGIIIKISDLMYHRSPRRIAEHIETPGTGDTGRTHFTLETGIPIVGGMMNVYYDRFIDKKTYGVLPTYYPIEGMSVEDIKALVRKVVEVHPILKGRLAKNDGVPWMYFDVEPLVFAYGGTH